MGPSSTAVVATRRLGTGSLCRVARRALVESVYLVTAPLTAVVGLLLTIVGLSLDAIGSLLPGRSSAAARAVTRWPGDLEWWRIGVACSLAGETAAGRRPRSLATDAPGPGLWLDAAHAVLVLPVVLVTWGATALWWSVGLATATYPLRAYSTSGPLQPLSLYVGNNASHLALSLGVTSPNSRLAFAMTLAVLFLMTLPVVTRVCVAMQAGLGQTLLSSTSALHRRISGLEQERDTARAQAVAVVTAEADALRRLERDIHDGPQQQLVRLAMELGRAQHHFDTEPELVRTALAEAVVQTQEALDELRALSRGIAPPILADRGLRNALSTLAERSAVPASLDAVAGTETVDVHLSIDMAVETAAYFVVAESLTNVAKHSGARCCTVGLRRVEAGLRVWVTDDGAGGAALAKGHGLQGLADRVLAVGGQLQVDSPDGGPTTITAQLPCR